MKARIWLLALMLLAGCGGGGNEKAAGPPKPKEPLAAAAQRFERALPQRDCKVLARFMLHSVSRGPGTKPNAPPTASECDYISGEVRNQLAGFRLSKVREFGPAGVTEGSGDKPQPGTVVGIVWVLDTDGSWRAVFDAIFRPQLGFRSAHANLTDNAQRFVTAGATRDCEGFWRLLNVSSRFVRNTNGDKAAFCKQNAQTYRRKLGGIADLAANPDAKPEELGAVRDLGFYGLRLKSGRYLVLVLSGRLGGFAVNEQKQHDNPSVVEFLTVRQPGA